MRNEPLVSIIIRTIDRPFMLQEALHSIRIQEYSHLEVIIVNDGGPDLDPVVDLFPDLEIKQVVNLNTKGRSYAGNQGLEQASGQYICFLDDDDIYYPFHISELVAELNKGESQVVYSDGLCAEQIVCPYDQRKYMTVGLSLLRSLDYDRAHLLNDNYIPLNSVMFTKAALGEIRFDENLDVLEDWDFWLNLSTQNDFFHVDSVTCEYRVRKDNTNTSGQLNHIWWWSREYLQEKHPDLTYGVKREDIC